MWPWLFGHEGDACIWYWHEAVYFSSEIEGSWCFYVAGVEKILRFLWAPFIKFIVLVIEEFFDVDWEVLVCFSVEGKLSSKFESFQVFVGIEPWIGILSLEDLFVREIAQHFSNIFLSFRYALCFQIIFLRHLLNSLNFLYLFRLEHALTDVKFQSLADEIVGLVSGKEGGEEDLAIDSGDGYRIIKNYCVESFLYLFNVIFWYLEECFFEE